MAGRFEETKGGVVWDGRIGREVLTIHVDRMNTKDAAIYMGLVLAALNETFDQPAEQMPKPKG